jgi:hypothetical protein
LVSTGYTNVGEEWAQKFIYRQDTLGTRDTTLEILLYDDSSDSLSDSSDIGDVTTEPTSGNYARQTVNLDSSDLSISLTNGDIRLQGTVTFDVTNTTESIDAFGGVISFQSDIVNAEGSQNAHLIFTADIGTSNLSNFTGNFEVQVNIDLT